MLKNIRLQYDSNSGFMLIADVEHVKDAVIRVFKWNENNVKDYLENYSVLSIEKSGISSNP